MIDSPLPGPRNMAVDQALLQTAAESSVGTLRLYQWQPATLSLGYFQNIANRRQHPASAECPVVRRASGGGAIVHDRELTYSLALPASSRWSAENRDLLIQVHQSLIACLSELGIVGGQLFRGAEKQSRSAPFLCFRRRADGDVVLDGEKVIGSAQRRLEKALLQHGSILTRRSPAAPELPGVVDLRPDSRFSVEKLVDRWPRVLAERLGWQMKVSGLSELENRSALEIERDRFGHPDWTRKR